jgi:hypothetical protein
METNAEYDPFSGPLAGITGRLAKLQDQVEWTRSEASLEEQLASIVFTTGMLVELVAELARQVSALLPSEG